MGLCLLRHSEACDTSKLENEILVKAYQKLNLKHCMFENTVNTNDSLVKVRKIDGVTCLLKATLLDKENNKAHFVLFQYYREENDEQKSLVYLKTAFTQN